MSDTVYSYLEDKESGGYVCLRIDRPPKNFNGPKFTYKISYAFCNPLDQFSKPKARKIVDGRMNSPKEGNYIVVSFDERVNANKVVKYALHESVISNSKHKPDWLSTPNWQRVNRFRNIGLARKNIARYKKHISRPDALGLKPVLPVGLEYSLMNETQS